MRDNPQMRTEPFTPAAYEYLASLCKNKYAADLIAEFWRMAEVWDDTVDKDGKESESAVNRAFLWAICGRDENPFLLEHPELRLAIKQTVAMWLAANALERSGEPDKIRTAYTLRCSPYLLFVSIVIAAAGVEAGAKAALFFYGGPDNDSFDAYMAEHMEKKDGMGHQCSAA
jgi:hypothetical protein